MATTAFPATAIFDSGATGRDLIQAANQAAAQAAIGIDPSDYGLLDSDNTWTGDNTFTQTLTVPHITSEGELLKLQSPTGYNLELFSGVARLVRLTYTEMQFLRDRIKPEVDDYSDLGQYNRRWSDVMAYRFGATESMTIYKVGNETETTNTETLETKWDSTKNSWVMRPKYSGSGTYRDFAIESSISNRAYIKFGIGGSTLGLGYGYHYTGGISHLSIGSTYITIGKDMYPTTSVVDTLNLGKTTNRWGNVASVNADFSGTVTANTITSTGGNLTLQRNSANAIAIGGTFIQCYHEIRPSLTNIYSNGTSSLIWSEVWQGKSFVRGNFTDASNYEYLETTYNSTSNYFQINSAALGTGTVRDIRISRDGDEGIWIDQSGIRFISAGSSRFVVQSSEIRMYKYLRSMNSTSTIGTANIPFPAVYSDLFSAADGSVTAPSYSFGSQSTMGIYRAATNQINMIAASGGKGFNLQSSSLSISSDTAFGWRSVPNISQGHSYDTLLARDATGIIAQRNFFQDAPQAFRIYGTWTDSSNGEWLQMDHGVTHANIATISNQDNGTGIGRHLYIKGADQLRLYSGGNLLHWVHTGTQAIYYKDAIRPHATSYIGTTSNRWAGGYFVDGDFSGRVLTDRLENVDGYSYIRVGSNTNSPIRSWRNLEPQLDDTFSSGNSTLRWSNVYSVDGSFSGNFNVETGGSFKFYNLGDSHTNTTNTELVSLYSTSNVFYMYSSATGSGSLRDFKIGSGATNIWFRNSLNAYIFTAGGSGKLEITTAGVIAQSDVFPWIDNSNLCGKAAHRWSAIHSYDADFSGTVRFANWDDGAGDSGNVQTVIPTQASESFWIDRTNSTVSSSGRVGLRTDYNASGTAHNYIAVTPTLVEIQIGNSLKAQWQAAGNLYRLNQNFQPYVDNTYYNGISNSIWTETWQGAAKIRGSYVDGSNYGYLSIDPDGDSYLIKANSLGTTADASIRIETSQKSAAGNRSIIFDADYNGQVSFYFGGNNRGYWSKDTLQPNVQVRTTVAYDINRNWNNASTVYQGYEANITDTASDSESSLLNLKVGGTSYLRLRKDGDLLFEKNGGSAAIVQNAGGIAIVGDNGSTVQSFDQYFNYTYKTFRPITDNQHLGYVSRRFLIKANDIYSKGKIRSYNLGDETAVDAEYLNLHWLSDHAYLTCEATGTGTARQFSVGTHTNGSIRFNHGTNTIRFSVGGVTATKAYFNANGLTVYGRVDPQGNKTRDLGTDSTARWRVGYLDTCDLDDGRINQMTSSTSDPSTTEYANDGDWGVHKNTSTSKIYMSCNSGGTIYKVELTSGGGGGGPTP